MQIPTPLLRYSMYILNADFTLYERFMHPCSFIM